MLKNSLEDICDQVQEIAIQAGELELKHFDPSGYDKVQYKEDSSPVTEADKAAEAFIKPALQELEPAIDFIGEESAAQRGGAQPGEYFWLVDPLDGTKEFISGSGSFTVNIALVHKGKPVLGVVYVPTTKQLFSGYGSDTAQENGTQIAVRPQPEGGVIVVASKSHGSGEKLDKFLKQFKVVDIIKRGSSLKICEIAAGRADLYPRFGPTCEWDTAAAHAILSAAGGFLCDEEGNELTYQGIGPTFLNPEFIASGQALDFSKKD
jgi:3'(2'), 5'-bisphosphate nucleotidase